MTQEICVLCGRSVGAKSKSYELTEKERYILKVLLQEDKGTVVYCQACDNLSKSPNAFAEFMRSVWVTKMHAAGVPYAVAEAQAKKAYDFFLSHATKPAS
jgi:hypothetical protein